MSTSKPLNEKKQLSFIYQPGIGFYDKKQQIKIDEKKSDQSTDENEHSTNEEKSLKRKSDLNLESTKKLCQTTSNENLPSQGLLLCPKEDESNKKFTKKKISSCTSTALLDDDSIVDSILFNELQSVQQQWQQFLLLTMEKELHIHPSDGKKKLKISKFNRTNEFLLAYESLYNFEGMKHWCPLLR